MVARLQQLILFTLLLCAVSVVGGLIATGYPAWACAAGLLIFLGYALVLAAEFVMLWCVQDELTAPMPRPIQMMRAWCGESLTAPRVFLWRQPFCSRAEPDCLPSQANGQMGVVLVHGFFCNRGFWNPWMRALRARGVPFIAVNLEPVFGTIDAYSSRIDAAVATMESITRKPVVLVGHSMGGVAIRAWHANYHAGGRMHRAITIGTPHQGTWMARFSQTMNGREMRSSSTWLAELAARETAAQRARFICFFGHCDNIVFPAAAGTLPAALNIHVPATAHVCMAFRPVVFEAVCKALNQ